MAELKDGWLSEGGAIDIGGENTGDRWVAKTLSWVSKIERGEAKILGNVVAHPTVTKAFWV